MVFSFSWKYLLVFDQKKGGKDFILFYYFKFC